MTKFYCLGFAFAHDDCGSVLVMQKQSAPGRNRLHPGKWNGLGGKVEDNELPVDAMAREFLEEAGITIFRSSWCQSAVFVSRDASWQMHVFGAISSGLYQFNRNHDEPLEIIPTLTHTLDHRVWAPYARMLLQHTAEFMKCGGVATDSLFISEKI